MNELFLKIINMSISASWIVLAVLLLRFLLRKAPKWVNVLLWGIVAVRLICPFSFESALSLIPSAETISPTIMTDQTPSVQTGIPVINSVINPVINDSFAPTPEGSANPLQIWIPVLSIIWLIGVAILLLYTAVSYWRLRRKVSEAVILRDNIYQSENVGSPFVLGIIKPRVYLTYKMDEQNLGHVVAHEQAHIRRKDHWWKPLGFLLLTIHWFNPLMWLAYVMLCRDIELACDEKVIKELGNEQRADYTQALVACSVNRRMIAACPLAFGEVGVKERVKSVMNYKKPAFWVIVLAIITCVVVAVCFLTNPATSVDERLAVFIDCEIASHNQTEHSKDNFCCLDWEVIGKETSGDLTTVYMWVLYKEYSNDDGLTVETASHLLTVITAKKDNGNYSLVEYWTPEDGSYYSDSIKEKVPMYLWGKAMDSQRYIDKQSEKLEKLAKEHFEGTTSNIGSADSSKSGSVVKWFDYLVAPDEMKWDGSLEINLPEFPDVTFRWSYGTMEAVVGNEIFSLYTGMPIWNTYFCDLTGDGLPELCSTISFGSGMIDDHIIIYDYANGASYSLQDRGVFDYRLRQGEDDELLYVDKSNYFGGGVVASGRLVFQDDCLQILGKNVPNDAILKIINPTDDPNFSYGTALEKIYEDENNEYFLSGLYSQYVIVHYTDGTQEDIVTALNSGRATIADLDKFGIRYGAEPKADPLDTAISTAILDHYRSSKPDGLIHVESHVLLASEVMSGTPLFGADDHAEKVTAYLLVHHVKYSIYGGTLEVVGGSYVPAAITFKVNDSGEYILEEYWEPRDGSYYAKDIRDKFPGASADDVLNDQAYIENLKAQTYNKALAYLNSTVSVDVRIVELLDEIQIQSSPALSSNPGDYIRANETEYDELLGYGEFTLRYCFSEFLQGGRTDLRGHIMALACEDIMLAWGEAYDIDHNPSTGQERFDEFRRNAESLAEQFSPEELEKSFPGAFLLLQMSSDNFATKGSE